MLFTCVITSPLCKVSNLFTYEPGKIDDINNTGVNLFFNFLYFNKLYVLFPSI